MLALPASKGGVNLRNPCETAETNYQTAKAATKMLVDALMGRGSWDARSYTQAFKLAVQVHKIKAAKAQWTRAWELRGLKTKVPNPLEAPDFGEANQLPEARLQGLTKAAFTRALVYPTHTPFIIRPSKELSTDLNSQQFRFAVAIRYGKQPPNAPPFCSGEGCHAPLTLDHSQTCRKGGSWILRHDTVKRALASCSKMATSTAPGDVRMEVPIDLGAGRDNAASSNPNQAPVMAPLRATLP